MKPGISLLIGLTLFCTMFGLGLSLELDALKRWIRNPAVPIRVVLGSCLLVPLVGLVLLSLPWSWSLPQPERTALALMAICPSAPLALRKTRKSGGDHQLAALIQISAALCAIATVPLMALLFRQTFSVSGWDVKPVEIAMQVGRVQVLPVLLGLGIRQWRDEIADRLETPLDRLANILLVLLAGIIMIKAGPLLIAALVGKVGALVFMALLVVTSLAIGWSLASDKTGERMTTSLVASMRNPGLALLLASRYGEGQVGLKVTILIYVVVTLLLSWPVVQRARSAQA
jgi:BASS family bile acid:Na+ symporter